MKRSTFAALAATAPLTPAATLRAQPPASAILLDWATRLVDELEPANNVYGSHPTFVEWADPATGRPARNRSVCSSFASRLLERSFGYSPADIDAWFGKRNPQAIEYHDAIVAKIGFRRIVHVAAIEPGDIIAIGNPAGSHPTGHVMLVATKPLVYGPTRPFVAETQQYVLEVIDSAASGHGPEDTRHRPGGGFTSGVGRGTCRLYARADGTIAGYTWSTTPRSLFRPASERRPAIGRYEPLRAPVPGSRDAGASLDPDAPNADDATFDEG